MKTATITFHAPNNNGSFFQAYALQKVLRDRFAVENQIIDFQSQKQIHQYSVFRPVHSARDLAKNGVSLLHYSAIKKHNERFAEMRAQYLRMSERCSTVEEAMQIADRYDVVIAGSDQIWNTGAPDFSEAYLLPEVKARKIAYAVSFGSVSNEAQLMNYKSDISSFSAISVREASAKEHLEKQIDRKIDVTLDPTLLLEPEDYLEMDCGAPLVEGDYIFFYSISYPPEVLEAAKKTAARLGMKIVTVFTSFHTIASERYGITVHYDAGPREFLNLILHAKLVLTNSFHGTAFSVLFKKPFYHICKTVGGQLQRDDRIDNVLEALGIRGCSAGIGQLPERLPDIDWDVVALKRGELQEHAFSYLKSAIGAERDAP